MRLHALEATCISGYMHTKLHEFRIFSLRSLLIIGMCQYIVNIVLVTAVWLSVKNHLHCLRQLCAHPVSFSNKILSVISEMKYVERRIDYL
jgi:hypothetical protein